MLIVIQFDQVKQSETSSEKRGTKGQEGSKNQEEEDLKGEEEDLKGEEEDLKGEESSLRMIGFQATVPPVFGRSPLFPSNVSVGVGNGVVSGYNGHSVLALNGSIHGPSLNGGSLNGSSSSSNGSSPLSGSPTNGMTVPVPSSHHRSSIVATPPNILDYYPGLGGDGLRISWYHAANSRSSLHAALTGN